MEFQEIIELYESKNAVPKLFIQKNIIGGILTIPKNILLNCPERELIYDIENNSFSVYENKHKSKTIESKFTFATVAIGIIDMIVTTSNQGYSFELCRVIDENKKCINKNDVMLDVFNAIIQKPSKKQTDLITAINTTMENNGEESIEIDKSIVDAYEYIMDYYQENLSV